MKRDLAQDVTEGKESVNGDVWVFTSKGTTFFTILAPLRIGLNALKFSPWWKKYGATGTHTITHHTP
jgi:hypothetical protein